MQPDTPLTVLVVDDDEPIREMLRSFLEERGICVLLAANAAETTTQPELETVDVALLDIHLGAGDDGLRLQKELNRRFPDMAKIIMSGQADLDDVIAAYSDQAFSFVSKPFSSLKEIALLIERAAQAKRLEIENRDYAAQLRAANSELRSEVAVRTEESRRFQTILAHLFDVSSQIGRLGHSEAVLNFLCQAVVEAGAFQRAAILLADERFRVRQAGVWEAGGAPDSLREQLRALCGRPLRPFEFARPEEWISGAVFARGTSGESAAVGDAKWKAGDQLFLPLLRDDGTTFGYLTVEAPADGKRPAAEIVRLLEVLLGHGSLQIEAQELREELRKRADELEHRVQERTRELRLSEDRFGRLVNATTDIVYIADEHDTLLFLNDAFTRVLGYVRENYVGRTLHRLLEDLTTENPINHRAMHDLSLFTADHTLHHVEILTRQGDKRTLEFNRTIIRQAGAVKGSQGIIRDITEHRVLLQQLVEAERLAATGRLAAGVAHEINNPLQAMASQLAAMQKKLERSEDPRDNLAMIREAVERMRYIIRSMLDLHRGPKLSRVAVNVNDVVEKAAALIGQQLRDHAVTLTLRLDPELPNVTGSPPELQQVALNLLVNALDAMSQGGDLEISTAFDKATVELRVKDTGIGIAAEHISQLFEPFLTFKPSGSGTGLGLYLSKNIMDLHGGSIRAESKPGEGTTFILNFPR